MHKTALRSVVLALLVAGSTTVLAAQGTTPLNRALATRADLEEALSSSGQGSAKLTARDRDIIGRRLKEGDFLKGDRLVITVQGEQALSDTFTVLDDQTITLPDMAPMSLRGVLRSELQDKLREHVSQYIRAPSVTAQALLRVGILGSVARPGYYSIRADQALGDLPTLAGGLTAESELGKTKILRNGQEFWPRDDVRRAMASGVSVDVLGMKGGDEFMVGRRGSGFGPTLAILTGIATLTTTVLLLASN
jgi:hypothetical protein